jgi:pyruvyltransferase
MNPKELAGIPGEHPFILPPKTVVKAYWWKGKNRLQNWGDWLTPLLLARFAHVEPRWTERGSADVVCVGSILGHIIGPWFKGTILGTGKLFEAQVVPPHATVLALRGPLSAKNVPGNYVLGDPGLLADELVQIETKKHDLCIIPHWSDKHLAFDEQFTRYPHVLINWADDPLTIIRTIAESHKVVTSSLHGLILADALMIPRRFEPSLEGEFAGDMFKFRDHNAAVGLPFIVGKLQEADSNRVIDRKTDLKDVFREYGKTVREHRRD